jgi:hypothetical protein
MENASVGAEEEDLGGDGSPEHGVLTIDCERCVGLGTSACEDCVVTFLCGRDTARSVVVDVGEARALRLLAGAGLIPVLRHERRGP